MLKLLVLCRSSILTALVALAAFSGIVVAGVRLTDIHLFESYLYAIPLLAMAFSAFFSNGSQMFVALSFGASRKKCYWGLQLAMLLVTVYSLAMVWLTFRLSDGWTQDTVLPDTGWQLLLLLFLIDLPVVQCNLLAQTMEKSWRKSLLVTVVWIVGFLTYLFIPVAWIIDADTLPGILWPVGMQHPVWRTIGCIYLVAALIMAVVTRFRFAKLEVRV